MTNLQLLTVVRKRISAIAPLNALTIGNESDKRTWITSYGAEVTAEQISAAQAIIDAFDPIAEESVEVIDSELQSLDANLPRCVEDLISVLEVDTTKLPEEMQTRLARKEELRSDRVTAVAVAAALE